MILLHSTEVFYSQNCECQILFTQQFQILQICQKNKTKILKSYDSCFLRFYAANSSRLIRNLHLYICLFCSPSVHSQKELSPSPPLSGRESLLGESQRAASRQTLQHDICWIGMECQFTRSTMLFSLYQTHQCIHD